MKKVYKIRIFDEEVSIKTDADEDRVKELTAYVEEKFTQVRTATPSAPRPYQMALAILDVANEFLDMRELVTGLKSHVEEMSTKLIVRIDSISPPEASTVN